MGTTNLAAESATRYSVYHIDPADIKLGTNGRAFPHDDVSVEAMVASFEKEGQLSDVIVRQLADKTVELVFGYRRHAAALRFNERHPGEKERMKLRCKVVTCNEEEAFVKNVAENDERINTGPIDKAFQQRILRERHGWTDTKIGELYKNKDGKPSSPGYIGQLAKLLLLPKDKQLLVNNGEWSVKMALDFLGLSKEEQEAVLNGQPSSPTPQPAASQESGSERHAEQSATPPEANGATANGKPEPLRQRIALASREKKIAAGGSKGRTIAEVKKFWAEIKAEDDSEKEAKIAELAKVMQEHLAGSISDRQLQNRLNKLFA